MYDTKKKKKKMHMPKYISTQECTDIIYFLLIGKIYEPASPTWQERKKIFIYIIFM